jgi:5'-AMP-activated protein kinase regulatory gamma subunit
MKSIMAFKLIPNSGKVVIFDSRLQVQDALQGLLHHDVNCAPVWDSAARQYVGMLTVSDFLDVLRHCWIKKEKITGTQRIADWQALKIRRKTSIRRLISISPESSLYDAVCLLIKFRVHRLTVQQRTIANTVLCVLPQHAILQLLRHQCAHWQEFSLTARQLGLGRVHEPAVVTYETPLHEALDLLIVHQISALPIVSEKGEVVDSYTRSDVKYLATNLATTNLTANLSTILQHHRVEAVCCTGSLDDTIWTHTNTLLQTGRHLVVCVHPENKTVEALLTLTEILCFLVGQRSVKSCFKPPDARLKSRRAEAAVKEELPPAALDLPREASLS